MPQRRVYPAKNLPRNTRKHKAPLTKCDLAKHAIIPPYLPCQQYAKPRTKKIKFALFKAFKCNDFPHSPPVNALLRPSQVSHVHTSAALITCFGSKGPTHSNISRACIRKSEDTRGFCTSALPEDIQTWHGAKSDFAVTLNLEKTSFSKARLLLCLPHSKTLFYRLFVTNVKRGRP